MGNPLFGKYQNLLKTTNCKSPQLQAALEECFANEINDNFDDFEFNDDDFDFGDSPPKPQPTYSSKPKKKSHKSGMEGLGKILGGGQSNFSPKPKVE